MAAEEVRGELAASQAGNRQYQPAHPRVEGLRPVAVTVALALLAALVRLDFKLFRRLGLEDLVQYLLRQPRQTVIPQKQVLQNLAVYGNLVLGHLSSPGDVGR